MSIFSDNLRKYREKTGKQAKEFSKEIGILYSTYANYEQGRSEPKIDVLVKIANGLGVSVDRLLGYKLDEVLGYELDEYEKTKEFLESLGITVSENIYIENGLMANIIQIVYPIDKAPQIKEASLRSFSFGSRIEFVNFINNASQEILKNNIVNYIVDYIQNFNNKYLTELIKYIKEHPEDKRFDKWRKDLEPISLGLKFPEANKKNPSPSEVGEGLEGRTPCNKS